MIALTMSMLVSMQAIKLRRGAKQQGHLWRGQLRGFVFRAADAASTTVLDDRDLSDRRSSATQAASTADSTHHKEVRGATDTPRATYNIVFVTAEVTPSSFHDRSEWPFVFRAMHY